MDVEFCFCSSVFFYFNQLCIFPHFTYSLKSNCGTVRLCVLTCDRGGLEILVASLFISPTRVIAFTCNVQVTLLKNLEVYGLDPAVVATALQHRVQASSVLQPVAGSKDKVLVQIQGNQIHQVGTLLLGL